VAAEQREASDEDLVLAAQADRAAFVALYRRYADPAYRHSRIRQMKNSLPKITRRWCDFNLSDVLLSKATGQSLSSEGYRSILRMPPHFAAILSS
jgi:hypothetical protein